MAVNAASPPVTYATRGPAASEHRKENNTKWSHADICEADVSMTG